VRFFCQVFVSTALGAELGPKPIVPDQSKRPVAVRAFLFLHRALVEFRKKRAEAVFTSPLGIADGPAARSVPMTMIQSETVGGFPGPGWIGVSQVEPGSDRAVIA
jgi:hypothetical protein